MLPHALFVFGKVSLGFFSVVDCVSCLDSKSIGLDSKFCFCESWLDCESETLKLDSKSSLDSKTMGLDSKFKSKLLKLDSKPL